MQNLVTYMFYRPKEYSSMWIRTAFFALFAYSIQAMGQTHLPDMTLEMDFAAQVKSVDEFIERFNGKETKPGIKPENRHRDNILSLFDFKMSHHGLDNESFKKQLSDFTKSAVNWNLSLSDRGTLAEAECLIKYAGKQYTISILLKRDSTNKGNNKWGIEGVNGIEKLGLYDKKRVTISPVDHETHFMSLQDFFQSNRKLVASLRANDKSIDQMSFFFGLCINKSIDFVRVENLKFHFMGMPKYNFVVEEIGREGSNSGWLITKIFNTPSPTDKEKYYKNLLGE